MRVASKGEDCSSCIGVGIRNVISHPCSDRQLLGALQLGQNPIIQLHVIISVLSGAAWEHDTPSSVFLIGSASYQRPVISVFTGVLCVSVKGVGGKRRGIFRIRLYWSLFQHLCRALGSVVNLQVINQTFIILS